VSSSIQSRRDRRDGRGQILVIAALAMVVIIGGVSLVIEGGNAYAQQRVVQNASDAVANGGATVLAERLGGAVRSDADVEARMAALATANQLDDFAAHYTTVDGKLLSSGGVVVGATGGAAAVGDGTIPPGAQGVRIAGDRAFDTTLARAIGFDEFTASADATAVTGALTGGLFMPVIFPVSMQDCDGTGTLISNLDAPWRLSNPGATPDDIPVGQEYLVPLCKTGGGSFMILDLDPDKNCYQETIDPTPIQFADFPVDVATDTGVDCAKKVEEAIADGALQGKVVMIPICDAECSTTGGTNGTYHIIRIAAFYIDYLSYVNNGTNAACDLITSPTYGTSMVNIVGGNGSSSCMAGWFVRYVTSGPVGSGQINNGEALGIQLIR
jgi:Flp pilus assembly protein TadG